MHVGPQTVTHRWRLSLRPWPMRPRCAAGPKNPCFFVYAVITHGCTINIQDPVVAADAAAVLLALHSDAAIAGWALPPTSLTATAAAPLSPALWTASAAAVAAVAAAWLVSLDRTCTGDAADDGSLLATVAAVLDRRAGLARVHAAAAFTTAEQVRAIFS